jgi:hypothetical protein
MDFLHWGVGDVACSGLVGWIIERRGEGVAVAVEEVDDTGRACACALGGAERLRRRELFHIPLPRFRRNRIALRPLACSVWFIVAGCVAGLLLAGRLSPAQAQPHRPGLRGQSFSGQFATPAPLQQLQAKRYVSAADEIVAS